MVLACNWKLEERCSELGKITYFHPMTCGMPLSRNPTSPVIADRKMTAAGYVVLKALRRTCLDWPLLRGVVRQRYAQLEKKMQLASSPYGMSAPSDLVDSYWFIERRL